MGQPGPSNDEEGIRQGGKPRIVDVAMLVEKIDPTKAYRPGLKSRTRELERCPDVRPMDTSEDNDDKPKRGTVKPSMKKNPIKKSPSTGVQSGNYRGRDMVHSSDNEPTAETAHMDPRTDCDASSEAESLTLSLLGEKRRGRGRPPSTGKGVLKREIEERQRKFDSLNKQVADMEEIAFGQYDVKERWKSADYKTMVTLEENYKMLPSRDIVAKLLERASTIHGVATRSANLKGTYVRDLKKVSMVVTVGSDVLSARSDEVTGQRELEQLRREVQNLKEEVERFRRKADTTQTAMRAGDKIIINPQNEERPMEVEMDPPISEGGLDYEMMESQKEYPKVVLPPREEWPAIRPAIKGKIKVLRDDTPPPAAKRRTAQAKGKKDVPKPVSNVSDQKKDMDENFGKFMNTMQEHMKNMYVNFLKEVRGDTGNGGSRFKAGTPIMMGGILPARPAPADGKRKKGKGNKIQTIPLLPQQTARPDRSRSGKREGDETPVATRSAAERPPSTWSEVIGRKAKRKAKAQAAQLQTTQTHKQSADATAKNKKKAKSAFKKRLPRSAAVVLTCPMDKYVETMTEVRKKISLAEVGIRGGVKTRRAATGA